MMNSKILEHLSRRPIAPIVDRSTEKSNTKALKVMCILDHGLDVAGLYTEIEATPKLMAQLLNIHSFASFKYFKYSLMKEAKIDSQILKCKRCELIAPYAVMLEHLAINHDLHYGAVMCMWCEKHEIQDHIASNSLDGCYKSYLNKHKFTSKECFPVVVSFYGLLQEMAKSLGVITRRTKDFKSIMSACNATLSIDQKDDLISNEIIVSTPIKRKYKEADELLMEKMFRHAMEHFYKQNAQLYTGKAKAKRVRETNSTIATQSKTNSFGSTVGGRSQMNVNVGPGSSQASSTSSSTRCDLAQLSSSFNASSLTSQFAQLPSLPPAMTNFKPCPMFDMPSKEWGFGSFVSSVVDSIQDEQLKERAKLEVKRIIFKYSAQDVAK